jgi:hypothetical protein
MVFLSLALRPAASRWTNLVVGAAYALTIITSAIGEGSAYSISSASWRSRWSC